jgi:hypothetical protein
MPNKKTLKFFLRFVLPLLALFICLPSSYAAGDQSLKHVVLNKFMAKNSPTIQTSAGNYSDWIELYNPTETSLDLGGMFLTDNLIDLKWQFSAGTLIEAHGYLIIWADNNVRQGSLHASFKLDAKNGVIGLIAADGTTLLDSVSYNKQVVDVSFGRTTDGGSSWNYLQNSTPGKANDNSSALFSEYPWEVWAIFSVGVMGCCLAIFKDKLRRSKLS